MSGDRGERVGSGATSKGILIVVMIAGLAALFTDAFSGAGNLTAYGAMLFAAVINRIESRRGAYKAVLSTAWGQASVERTERKAGRPIKAPEGTGVREANKNV